jgi:hypothetical protein
VATVKLCDECLKEGKQVEAMYTISVNLVYIANECGPVDLCQEHFDKLCPGLGKIYTGK